MKRRLLAVDPGVNGTGWALFDLVTFCPTSWGTVYSLAADAWQDRALEIVSKFERQVVGLNVLKVHIEFPKFMGGSAGLMVAARGDLIKLGVLTGMLVGKCTSLFPQAILSLPTPNDWKGQLPKEVCRERIEKFYKRKFTGDSSHAIDAIGIGMWALGKF